jgi:ribose transport system permease protein
MIGTVNAFIAVRVGVPSIVTTLGTSTLIGGILLGVTGPQIRSGLDPGFVDLVRTRQLGLPGSFWLALVLTIVVWYLLQHTPLGRHLLFVGKGREVARLSGVRVDAIRFGSLVVSAMMAALGGMILAGTSASAQVGVGGGYLLPAFAAAFLGATAIIPGQFNAWGSWVAVYFLLTGITGLSMVGYAGWPEQVFYGGALIVAVVLSQLAARARGRAALRPS